MLSVPQDAIREMVIRRARRSDRSSEDRQGVRLIINLRVSNEYPEYAVVHHYELQLEQMGMNRIDARGIFSRTDIVFVQDGQLRFLESHAKRLIGDPICCASEVPEVIDLPHTNATDRDFRAIEALNSSYAELIDAGEFEGFAALFKYGEWNGMQSKRRIVSWLKENLTLGEDGRIGRAHVIANLTVEIDPNGQNARGQSTLIIYRESNGRVEPHIVNENYDKYARDDDGWYFVERKIERRLRTI